MNTLTAIAPVITADHDALRRDFPLAVCDPSQARRPSAADAAAYRAARRRIAARFDRI